MSDVYRIDSCPIKYYDADTLQATQTNAFQTPQEYHAQCTSKFNVRA